MGLDFSAALNMEHSDLWMISNNTTDTTLRDPHTHHITMKNAQVIFDQSYIASHCPTVHYVVPPQKGGTGLEYFQESSRIGADVPAHPVRRPRPRASLAVWHACFWLC